MHDENDKPINSEIGQTHSHEHAHSHEHPHEHDGGSHEGHKHEGHSHDGHIHEHEHTHKHEHSHEGGLDGSHSHEDHSHGDHPHINEAGAGASDGQNASKEMETLYALIGHWAEHADSHVESYSEWAQKASANGKAECAKAIEDAIEYSRKAAQALREAKEKLN